MAISDTARHSDLYSPNGSTTRFAFGFVVFDATQVAVYESDGDTDSLVSSSRFTVVLNDDQDNHPGGFVEFADAPAAGKKLRILSAVPYHQPMVLTNRGGFYPDVINRNADLQCAQIQQLREELDRSVKIPATSESTADALRDALLVGRQYSQVIAENITAVAQAGQLAPEIRVIAGDITGSIDGSWNHDFGTAGVDDTDITLPGGGNIVTVASNIESVRNAALVGKSIVNVTAYGATGDGVTDDTAALNAALAAATGKCLYLPAGTYLTKTGIAIPSNTEVRGDGMWNTTIKLHASAPKKTHCIRNEQNNWPLTAVAYTDNAGNSGIVIRDLCADGNCWNTTDDGRSGCAIQLANVHNTRLENVRAINGKLHCIDICSNAYAENNTADWYVGASSHVTVINCVAYDSKNDDAITIHFSHDITVINPIIYRTRALHSSTTHGLEVDDGSYRVRVIGGHIEGHNMGVQVKAHQSQRFAPHDVLLDGVVCRQNLCNFAITHNGGDITNYKQDAYCRNINLTNCTSVTPIKPSAESASALYWSFTADLYMHTVGGAVVNGFKVVGDDSTRAGGVVADGSLSTSGSIYLSRVYQLSMTGTQFVKRDAVVGLIYMTNYSKWNSFRDTSAVECGEIPVFHFHTSNESGSIDGVQASRTSSSSNPTVIDAASTTLNGVSRVYRSGYASDLVDSNGTHSIGVSGHFINVVS